MKGWTYKLKQEDDYGRREKRGIWYKMWDGWMSWVGLNSFDEWRLLWTVILWHISPGGTTTWIEWVIGLSSYTCWLNFYPLSLIIRWPLFILLKICWPLFTGMYWIVLALFFLSVWNLERFDSLGGTLFLKICVNAVFGIFVQRHGLNSFNQVLTVRIRGEVLWCYGLNTRLRYRFLVQIPPVISGKVTVYFHSLFSYCWDTSESFCF